MPYRYSRWDGSQERPDLDADDVLAAMADELTAHGDPRRALERLWQRGFRTREGAHVPGLRDLLERLRRERQAMLERHRMDAGLEAMRRALDDVLRTERTGIERRVDQARRQAAAPANPEAAERLRELERLAAERATALDALPPDVGGAIRALQDYQFVDLEAWQKFQELMMRLRRDLVQGQVGGLMDALRRMGPAETQALREMLRDLNRLLREARAGGHPDFEAFRQQWGGMFPGVSSLEELLERLVRQAARLESLLESLSPAERQELLALQEALLDEPGLREALEALGDHLAALAPGEGGRRYRFRGQEPVSLEQALDLMGTLHDLDRLEGELRAAEQGGQPEDIDAEALGRLLGPEAAAHIEQLRRLAAELEARGYLERKGRRWALTPRAIRRIGQRALAEIFAQLRRDRPGGHALDRRGAGGDRSDETKRYAFGDPFLLDLRATLGHALGRQGPGLPVRLHPDDFEVFRTEEATRCATVLLLDMSRSMIYRDCWHAAKRVALALHALIAGQYPRDYLGVVGFALYARELPRDALPQVQITPRNYGTNMHHALLLARQLLARQRAANRQVIMVTDGEPTAHLEGTEAYFDYPTTARTWQLTRKEVLRCSREDIRINTFMLDDSPGLVAWVEEMARLNRGRALHVTPDRLGQYLLVDFVAGRQRRVG